MNLSDSWSRWTDVYDKNTDFRKISIDAQKQKISTSVKEYPVKIVLCFFCPRMFFVFGCRGSVHWFAHEFYSTWKKYVSLLNSMEQQLRPYKMGYELLLATLLGVNLICTWEHLTPTRSSENCALCLVRMITMGDGFNDFKSRVTLL